MPSYQPLTDLHQCHGLNLFLTPSVLVEIESQIYCGVACRLTFLQAQHLDSHWLENNTSSDLIQSIERHGTSLNQLKRMTMSDSEDWDVDSTPLSDGDHEKHLADLLANSKPFIKKMRKHVDDAARSVQPVPSPPIPKTEWNQVANLENRKFTFVVSNPRKLHVRNISFRTAQRKVWAFFKQFGPVEFFQLLKDPRGRSKGRGFVTFVEESTAQKVLNLPEDELELDKRILQVLPATLKKYDPEHQDQTHHEAKFTENDDFQQVGIDEVAPINELPDDVLLLIFKLLRLRDRFMCERVCKKWRDLAMRTWQSMETLTFSYTVRQFGGIRNRQFRKLLKRGCLALKYIDLSSASRFLGDDALDAIANYCPHINHLNLSGMHISNKGLRMLSSKCTNIQTINMSNCHDIGEDGLWWLFHQCKSLSKIILENNQRLLGKCFHVLCWNAERICLDGCSKLQDLAIQKIVMRSRNLKELNLSRCITLSDQGISELVKCTDLKVLHVCGSLPDATVAGMISLASLPHLEELILQSNQTMVSDELLCALGRYCNKLRVLDITSCHSGITDEGISGLSECKYLHTLKISYITQISEGLSCVAVMCSLRNLQARGCTRLSEESLHTLACSCLSLEEVDISGCYQIGNSVLNSFVDTVLGDPSRHVTLCIGGTSINSEGLEPPCGLTVVQQDYCMYGLCRDNDLALYMGDSDSDEYDFDGYEIGAAEAHDYLEADDPLYYEELT